MKVFQISVPPVPTSNFSSSHQAHSWQSYHKWTSPWVFLVLIFVLFSAISVGQSMWPLPCLEGPDSAHPQLLLLTALITLWLIELLTPQSHVVIQLCVDLSPFWHSVYCPSIVPASSPGLIPDYSLSSVVSPSVDVPAITGDDAQYNVDVEQQIAMSPLLLGVCPSLRLALFFLGIPQCL